MLYELLERPDTAYPKRQLEDPFKMNYENQESVQLLNTAIIKSKEKNINSAYEERLAEICQTPAVKSLGYAVTQLAETQKISRDAAALQIIETVRELETIWSDYVTMEGITKLKDFLKEQ